MQHNYVLTVAYDGSHYMGWQKTSTGKSIEGELEKALTTLLQHPIQLQAASRTDRGVHAHGQVVNFFTEKKLDCSTLHRRIQRLLPDDIVILLAEEKPLQFHPTIDTIGKEYHYHIANVPVILPRYRFTHWHIREPLDLDLMKKALLLFEGTHDFKAFCNFRKGLSYPTTERTIFKAHLSEELPGFLRIEIYGDHFLYKMARNLIGTAVYVGLKKIALSELQKIIESKKRANAGITAPALGLVLHHVFYPSAR